MLATPAIGSETLLPVAAAKQSVVSVLPVWRGRPPSPEEPEGSGVVVGDGTEILTADHILGDPVSVRVRTADGDVVMARVVARDVASDMALLAVDVALPPVMPSVEIYPPVGARVCAIGNAFGLGLSLSCGTVSAVARSGVGFNEIEDFVQTDAEVNPGMSGGALVDEEGRLVGLLSAIFTKRSDASIGVNFAVSGPLAARALQRLRAGAAGGWPDPGLALEPYPPPGETGRSGAHVRNVVPGGQAATAGIEIGDVIVMAGDRRVRGPADMRAAYVLAAPGSALTMTVLRGDSTVEIPLPAAP
ncbi:MAG TPA: trypsin-like peptidase domain-containing protein [Afifellaceae bacterium]|nr:trypsin-like peptidase domain-containing protein [Afifellaceae bacterium]